MSIRLIARIALTQERSYSVDRLLLVLINDLFPSYVHTPPEHAKPDPALVQVTMQAHRLWQGGTFDGTETDDGQIWVMPRNER
jgi:hypothetical protein